MITLMGDVDLDGVFIVSRICKEFYIFFGFVDEGEKLNELSWGISYHCGGTLNFLSCIDKVPRHRLINYHLFALGSSASGLDFYIGFFVSILMGFCTLLLNQE
jgi:hypothetical protein